MSIAELADKALPFNRKERFFTGTVFPMLVCADDFKHFSRLTSLLGLGPIEVDARPSTANVQFFTEYGFAESRYGRARERFPGEPRPRDTPDVMIFVEGTRRLLIALEAKMYDVPTAAELNDQLAAQAELLEYIAKNLAPCTIVHAALLPQALAATVGQLSKPTVTWEELRAAYHDVAPPYFVAMLDTALERYSELKASRPGWNSEARRTGGQLFQSHVDRTQTMLWMGRSGGLKGSELKKDIETGAWRNQSYECSSKRVENANWFPVEEFVALIGLSGGA